MLRNSLKNRVDATLVVYVIIKYYRFIDIIFTVQILSDFNEHLFG